MSPLPYNNTTASAEREFNKLENPILEDAAYIIARWLSPEDIFDYETLSEWAEEHGFVKEE